MTNEEAIMILKAMIDEMILVFDRDRKKALNMAIEALKEQSKHSQNTSSKQPDLETLGIKTEKTCEDVISRQQAVKVILADKIVGKSLIVMKALGDGRLALTLNDACDRHIRAIEHLPSAQPEPDIIACGDCKHWICHDKRCGYWNHGVKPLDWCCHGERRTDE